MFKLRDYQDRAKNDIGDFLFNSSYKKGILVAPTGAGKALFTAIIAEMVNEPLLVIQPTKELLEQNLDKAHKIGLNPTVYSASMGVKEISNLTYATPLSIVKKPEDFKHFHTVVIDECHLFSSNKITNGKVSDKGKLSEFLDNINVDKIIGLTATPIQLTPSRNGSELKMMDRSMRSFWYKSDIFHVSQIKDICEKYWANIEFDISNDVDDELLKLNSNGSEFREETVIKNYDYNDTENKIIEKYNTMVDEGIESVLIFVPSVAQGESLVKKNPKNFVLLHSDTPEKERNEIIKAFKSKSIPAVVNVNILATGFDFPELDGIIMARETNSFSVYYQQFGRLVRPILSNGDIIDTNKKFVDLTGNTKRFGDIRNTTFEKNDYTNGWAMWNGDSLMTGYPFGNWNMPTRESLIKKYKKQGVVSYKYKSNNIIIKFGKYKNKDLYKSFEKDPNYFIWMFENIEFNKPWNKELKKPIEKLINKHLMHGK